MRSAKEFLRGAHDDDASVTTWTCRHLPEPVVFHPLGAPVPDQPVPDQPVPDQPGPDQQVPE